MSILTLLQDVANQMNIPSFTKVIGNSDNSAKQLLSLAQNEGEDRKRRYEWPQLTREYAWTLVSGQEAYPFPGDFDNFIFRTMWARGYHWELEGPTSSQEWQWRKSGGITSSPRQRFRIKGVGANQIFIDPPPSASNAGQVMVFEYISTNWVLPILWTQTQIFLPGSYCHYGNNYYVSTLGGVSGATPPTHTAGALTDGGIVWSYVSTPYTTFKADSDLIVFDEYTFKLGVKWRFRKEKGLEWQSFKDEWDQALPVEASAEIGAKTLSMADDIGRIFISPRQVPDTGYGS